MNYELAKQLKEAGFPNIRETSPSYEIGDGYAGYVVHDMMPTLSELIKACGDRFRWLGLGLPNNKFNPKWCAQARGITLGDSVRTKDIKISGCSTAEEAVALLYLKLHE